MQPVNCCADCFGNDTRWTAGKSLLQDYLDLMDASDTPVFRVWYSLENGTATITVLAWESQNLKPIGTLVIQSVVAHCNCCSCCNSKPEIIQMQDMSGQWNMQIDANASFLKTIRFLVLAPGEKRVAHIGPVNRQNYTNVRRCYKVAFPAWLPTQAKALLIGACCYMVRFYLSIQFCFF